MQALGPFDPLALSAGLFTSLAYDILKHRVQSAQSLEGTLAGKMLKWAGILEPNFDDRLRDTLSKTLSVYFKEHPNYALSGIAAFFQDGAVAQQIADYILDRHPLDYTQLESAFEQHFNAGHPTSKILFQDRGLSSKQVIDDFFRSYRRVLGEQLSIPEMGLLLDMLDQTTTTVNEIQASEQRLKEYITTLVETRLSPDVLKAAYQQGQQQLVQDLTAEVRSALGTGKYIIQNTGTVQGQIIGDGNTLSQTFGIVPPSPLVAGPTEKGVPTPAPQNRPVLFTDGLCSGYLFQPTPDYYFVSHGFAPDILPDWRAAIVDALSHPEISSTPLKPYFAGDTTIGGFRLCGICAKLYSARFSLFLLPAVENANVYIELGIAIGLGAPFFLIQERDAALPPLLAGLGLYTQRGSLRAMRRELAGQVREYNFGAVRFVKEQAPPPLQSQYLIGAGEQLDDEDLETSITEAIERAYPQRLSPVSLSSISGEGFALQQLVSTIESTRFALYRIDETSSATTFLALGISLGLGRPLLMLHRTSSVPLDLRGMQSYAFPNFTTLEKQLTTRHRLFFDRYIQ
jgi:hypothetical protein